MGREEEEEEHLYLQMSREKEKEEEEGEQIHRKMGTEEEEDGERTTTIPLGEKVDPQKSLWNFRPILRSRLFLFWVRTLAFEGQ